MHRVLCTAHSTITFNAQYYADAKSSLDLSDIGFLVSAIQLLSTHTNAGSMAVFDRSSLDLCPHLLKAVGQALSVSRQGCQVQLLALGDLSFEACYPAFLLQNGLQAQPKYCCWFSSRSAQWDALQPGAALGHIASDTC